MSSAKPMGGPAFPVEHLGINGLSIRDYFAANAMQGALAGSWTMADMGYAMKDGKSVIENNALFAYEIADAMLAARAEVKD